MIIIVSSFCFAIPLLIILLFPRYFADIINDVFQWFCGVGDASVGYLVISLSASLMLPFMPVSCLWFLQIPGVSRLLLSKSHPPLPCVLVVTDSVAESGQSCPPPLRLSLPTLAAGWKLRQRGRTQLWHLLEALIQITLQHWICMHFTSGWAPRSKLHEAVWTGFGSPSSSTVRSNLKTGLSLLSPSHPPGPNSTSSFNLPRYQQQWLKPISVFTAFGLQRDLRFNR